MPNGNCTKGVENEQRIVALERDVVELKAAIHEIRDELLGRLPNWATVAITLLTALVVGLAVALLG
jgi:hypothetical protein